jgi:hypothetical protein
MNARRGRSFESGRVRAASSVAALGLLLFGDAARAQDPPAGDSTAPPAPADTPAATPAPAHPPPHTETEPRKGLIIGGAVTWAVGYTFSLMGSSASDGDLARHWLYVPVAGPFLFLANRQRCPGNQPDACVDDFLTPVVFAMFGVVQTVGAALAAGGFLFPRERAVSWVVAPSVVGQSGVGVAAAGTLF